MEKPVKTYAWNSMSYRIALAFLAMLFLFLAYLVVATFVDTIIWHKPRSAPINAKNDPLIGTAVFTFIFVYLALKFFLQMVYGLRVKISEDKLTINGLKCRLDECEAFAIKGSTLVLYKYQMYPKEREFREEIFIGGIAANDASFAGEMKNHLPERNSGEDKPSWNNYLKAILIYPWL